MKTLRIKVTLFLAISAAFASLNAQSSYPFLLLSKIKTPVSSTSQPSLPKDSISPKKDTAAHFRTLLIGVVPNTKIEKHLGGTDTNLLSLVLLPENQADTLRLNRLYPFYPCLMANLPFDDSFFSPVLVASKQLFTVGVLKADSSEFLSLKNWLIHTPIHPVSMPDSVEKLTLSPISLSEFTLPLPCTHSEFYLEYLGNQSFNVSIDQNIEKQVSKSQVLEHVLKFSQHLNRFHQKCALNLHMHFNNRTMNIAEVSELMADLSDLGCVIKTSFND